jgi:hypothetical protein
MIKIFNDKTQLIECKINITGDNFSKVIPRLILKGDNNLKNIIIEGKIDGDNKLNFSIPPINEFTNGTAFIEVIADNMYFSPWSSDFKVEKCLQLENVIVKPTVESKPKIEVIVEEKTDKIRKPNYLKEIFSQFQLEYESLNSDKKKALLKEIKKLKISDSTQKIVNKNSNYFNNKPRIYQQIVEYKLN